MKRIVSVWGSNCEVTVEQQSKSVWVASGDYMGVLLSTKDRTAATALKRWQEAAAYKGG
jgi:hypothetical protein